jgi:glycosyltransferase involved in cell wall biosynthesis
MKVVHIITGLNQGGAESALFRLVTYSKSDSILNIVVSITDLGVYGNRLRAEGIEVFVLDMPRRIITIKGIRLLWEILKSQKPDVVQTWMYHADLIGGVVAKIAGVKKIIWGVVNFNLDNEITPLTTRITAKLCARLSGIVPNIIISCSERAIGVHQKLGYKDKFVVIPLGFDLSKYSFDLAGRISMRRQWNLRHEDIVIGCVARWDPQKDHKNLINAFAIVSMEYPKVNCVLVGPKMNLQNKELVNLIKKSYGDGNRIITLGVSESISETMNALDLHILPSLGEAFPNVVAEAMACGIPNVVTDVGDACIIVGNTGWVVPPGNSFQLASAIINAISNLNDSAEWQQRKVACRNRILENYSMEKMKENYLSAWSN